MKTSQTGHDDSENKYAGCQLSWHPPSPTVTKKLSPERVSLASCKNVKDIMIILNRVSDVRMTTWIPIE